jgi:CO dehydrogenase/acetyl-CoA synthase beta subunit
VGHSKFNITQKKFILGPPDGGLLRMVWMPKSLKEELKDRLDARGKELGYPNLYDMIADETVGTTEEEIMPFLQEKGHPADEPWRRLSVDNDYMSRPRFPVWPGDWFPQRTGLLLTNS